MFQFPLCERVRRQLKKQLQRQLLTRLLMWKQLINQTRTRILLIYALLLLLLTGISIPIF